MGDGDCEGSSLGSMCRNDLLAGGSGSEVNSRGRSFEERREDTDVLSGVLSPERSNVTDR